ncbi:MAG: c-type cytochrome, partial [Blastocatellia bacterium]
MRIRRSVSVALAATFCLTAALAFVLSSSANPKKAANVTFTKDVAPIFFKQCAECHRPGESAPFSTMSYKDLRPWAKSIKQKVTDRTMPPWHADPHYGEFKNDRRLSQKEIDTIVAWVDAGAPEGNAKDLPPTPKFTEGWNITTPDVVITLPEEYQYK